MSSMLGLVDGVTSGVGRGFSNGKGTGDSSVLDAAVMERVGELGRTVEPEGGSWRVRRLPNISSNASDVSSKALDTLPPRMYNSRMHGNNISSGGPGATVTPCSDGVKSQATPYSSVPSACDSFVKHQMCLWI